MTHTLSPLALDALGEVSNIGAGHAANALAQLVGSPVDLDVPAAQLVPLAYATEAIGSPEDEVLAVLTGVHGGVDGTVLLVFAPDGAEHLCRLLGTDAASELGVSALQEIGNILTGAYVTAIGRLTGLPLQPYPPVSGTNMLGALVDEALATAAVQSDAVLLVRTAMHVGGKQTDFSFLFVPDETGVQRLLASLGIAG